MKKLLKKIAILILSSILLNLFAINFASADWSVPSETLDQYKDKQCVTAENSTGKIVTILEEAIPVSTTGTDNELTTFYRHSIEATMKKGDAPKLYSSLSNKDAKCISPGPPAPTGYPKIIYSCYEVQVIFSTGGTSLLFAYIGMIYRWGASMAGIIAVLVIVLSGMQISASGGDGEAITKAKTRILKSFAGIAVLFLASLILYTINPTFFTLN